MSTDPTTATVTEEKKDTEFVLTDLLGHKAVTPSGESISIDSEWGNGKKKTIAFYFSAHWCPPCRKFTPKLVKAYQEYKEKNNGKDDFELVFVSSDSNENEFKEYHGTMSFPALDYSESRGSIKEKLSERFNVEGIPSLAVMDAKTGERLDLFVDEDVDEEDDATKKVSAEDRWAMDPRALVEHFGANAFPLSKASCDRCVEMGNQEQLKALEEVMPLPNAILPPTDKEHQDSSTTTTYTLAKLLETYRFVGIMLGSKSALEMLPSIAKVMKEANKDNNKSLAIVYVPGCFTEWDEYVDQPYKEDNMKDLFHFQENPTPDTIDLLKRTAGQVKYDTLVLVQETSKQVEECGMDGICTSMEVKGVGLVCTDNFASNCTHHGADFLPWDKSQVEKAVAEEKARAVETKAKMEASLESFLLDLAAEGKMLIGDSSNARAVADRLNALNDEEGLIGILYHARPSFLPKLVDCFEEINQTPTKDGKKKLEIVYVGPRLNDQSDFDEGYKKMITEKSKTQFMAIACPDVLLRRSMHGAFIQEQYDPTCIILMKKDGTVVSAEDDTADAISSTGHWGFPWNEEGIAKGEEKMKALVKAEDERCEQVQKEMGIPLVRRMIGSGRGVKHIPEERIIKPSDCGFVTYGTQDAVVMSDTESNYDACSDTGVFYYEIEILKLGKWAHATQMGFCVPGALDELIEKGGRGSGCGDAKNSFAVCGLRGELWTDNNSSTWFDPKDASEDSTFNTWKDGDVVGLAVNVNVGKIAVSVNAGNFAVVFQDEEAMKAKGVFPCFSIDEDVEIRVNMTRATFKHSGPSAEAWLLEPPKKVEAKED